MSRAHGPRLRATLLLSISLAVHWSCRAAQEPEAASEESDAIERLSGRVDELAALVQRALAQPGDIHIKIVAVGSDPRLGGLTPRAQGVCKTPVDDCRDGVKWKLTPPGTALPNGYTVEIAEKATSPAKGCFAAPYVLGGTTTEQESGPPDASCQKPNTVWSYDVLLKRGNEVVDRIDPVLVMYY